MMIIAVYSQCLYSCHGNNYAADLTLHEASSFTELHHWFTHVFHASKATVI